ncbi:hypothetical protein LOD99_6603 [Oopsacas minuta]|uniref:Uncharacterized protein n=1 Tax=Oopsacas minuta TaxID=111878 RepID=A0AAV7JLU6_9METZ|nr:hypothetical protein LOD99_6603 [Oopsacas minuta]
MTQSLSSSESILSYPCNMSALLDDDCFTPNIQEFTDDLPNLPLLDNEYLELSHHSQLSGCFEEPNDIVSGDEIHETFSCDETISFPSETSFITSPSLQSMHLHDNQVSSLYYGMQPTHFLSRNQNNPILSVTYSDRTHKFILLDPAGILSWCPENNHIERQYLYPPYKHKLFLEIHFSSKFNVYFVLTKKRSIIIFNSIFESLHVTTCLENSLLSISFLDARCLLIGAGVNGVSLWNYIKHDNNKNLYARIRPQRPMENYILSSPILTKIPDNKLIRKIIICYERKWIFALSFYDVFVLTFDGRLCKCFFHLHKQTITDCMYNTHHSLLLTVSNDSTLTLWSECGFPLHTFYSAAKSNNAVLQHPFSPHLVLVATDKGSIKCYNLLTLEEEFTQHIMDCYIEKINNVYITKQYLLFAASKDNISVLDFNYFCEYWGRLDNSLLYICFDKCEQKSDRFHALCVDGTIRIYSISQSRPISLVLPPPNIHFPSSFGSVAYDRNSSLLYILIGPQEIWVYTTKTHPSCLLEVYKQDVILRILSPVDPDTGDILHTGKSLQSFICTCLAFLYFPINFWTHNSVTHSNLLMVGLKDGRLVFISTGQEFIKLFEMQVSTGEVTSLRVSENSSELITQSVSVSGFALKLWSLPGLELLYSFELHGSLIAYWKVHNIIMAGFTDGSLSLYSTRDMGSSLCGGSMNTSGKEGKGSFDEIISIHGLERLNVFCTAHKSGLVKIWDHHKNLVKVISLNNSLGGVYFLNNSGDLLVSLNRHLYVIRHEHLLSSYSIIQDTGNNKDHNNSLAESAVFENPNSQNGELVSTKYGLYYVDTMQSYLKPYDIDLHGPNGLSILDEMLDKVAKESVCSLSSHNSEEIPPIPSKLFISPSQTPLILSYDNFPLPVFSTPTVSRTSTPPPSEVEKKETLRKEIALIEMEADKISQTDSSLVNEHRIELQPRIIDSKYIDEEKSNVPPNKPTQPTFRAEPIRFNPRVNIKSQTSQSKVKTHEDLVEIRTEVVTNILDGLVAKPITTITPKTRVLRKKRISRQVTESTENLSTSTIPIPQPAGDINNVSITQIKTVIRPKKRKVSSKINSKIVEESKDSYTEGELLHHQSIQDPPQFDIEVTHQPLGPNNTSKVIEAKRTPRKKFSLNMNNDYSVGWQEREYIRRLAYRFKECERNVNVWAYQAKHDMDRCMLRAKYYPDERKQSVVSQSIDVIRFLESTDNKDGYSSNLTQRNSTTTTSSSIVLSTSSYYAHKIKTDSVCNFRIGNTPQEPLLFKDNQFALRKSRCASAPFLRKSISKVF